MCREGKEGGSEGVLVYRECKRGKEGKVEGYHFLN